MFFLIVCVSIKNLFKILHPSSSIHILPHSPWRSPVTLTNFASMAYRTLGAADLPTWGNRWKWKSRLVNIKRNVPLFQWCVCLGLLMSLDVFGISTKVIKNHQTSWNPYEIPMNSLWNPYEFPIYQPSPAYGVISSNEPWRPPDLAPKERLETTRATANVGGPVGQWLQHCWSKMVRNSNLHLFTYTNSEIHVACIGYDQV